MPAVTGTEGCTRPRRMPANSDDEAVSPFVLYGGDGLARLDAVAGEISNEGTTKPSTGARSTREALAAAPGSTPGLPVSGCAPPCWIRGQKVAAIRLYHGVAVLPRGSRGRRDHIGRVVAASAGVAFGHDGVDEDRGPQ